MPWGFTIQRVILVPWWLHYRQGQQCFEASQYREWFSCCSVFITYRVSNAVRLHYTESNSRAIVASLQTGSAILWGFTVQRAILLLSWLRYRQGQQCCEASQYREWFSCCSVFITYRVSNAVRLHYTESNSRAIVASLQTGSAILWGFTVQRAILLLMSSLQTGSIMLLHGAFTVQRVSNFAAGVALLHTGSVMLPGGFALIYVIEKRSQKWRATIQQSSTLVQGTSLIKV